MNDTIAGLRISLASPAQIRAWSYGQVTEPSTINYQTFLPEENGLFCERIFGPLQDWTCACRKYKRVRQPGLVCEQCEVPVVPSRVRRERLGHIELAVPVAHPWFARGTPSILAMLLNLSPRELNAVLAYTGYIVTRVDTSRRAFALESLDETEQPLRQLLAGLTVGAFLDETQLSLLRLAHSDCFVAETGAQACLRLLLRLDLTTLSASLKQAIGSGIGNPKKAIKRLYIVEALRRSGVDPSWMITDVIAVLPPDLRPLVHLRGGRFATSDLNALYERIIYRNARIERFLKHHAPAAMINYEKRLLQDAVDALFDNARCARPLMGSHRQPLKSLTDMLKGKQGRFRRNLLGKRVDYSGRSVICVGLDLELHECGLPKKMALELFKPFVMRRLLDWKIAPTRRAAKRMVERRDRRCWDALADCMEEKLVLLNRAPTLHRLSIQAFAPKLVEGDAIRLHPLVCSAFNADFDGDQMAVHLPLSDAAQAEARQLLLSTRNLRSPATGDPAISLSQEIVLGCFYLTEARESTDEGLHVFVDANEAKLAYEQGIIAVHTPILVRIEDETCYDAPPPAPTYIPKRGRIQTTVGRLIFNELLPACFGYRNYAMTKERLKQLVAESLKLVGEYETARLADEIKQLGYRYATISGISFAMSDMAEPPEKQTLVAEGQMEAKAVDQQYQEGIINEEERNQAKIALWSKKTEEISDKLLALLDPYGTLSTIIKSGATKAKFQQIRQLSGIRGLMADPSGRIIPIPVLGNYLSGLQGWEIFIAASGARKGFMDRSLNTAQSGYLTRKLVETGMEVWTTCLDCGTNEGWLITNEQGLSDLRSRIVGRVLGEAVGGISAGTLLDEAQVDHLLASGISAVRVRSPFTCEADYGICCRCYGADLATGELVSRGVAVGIIAGQSIGEPGTQLTMRTFHSGGIANAQGDITAGLPRVKELFEAYIPKGAALLAEIEGTVELSAGKLRIIGDDESREYYIDQSLLVSDGQRVCIGMPLTSGASNPKQILNLQGREACARYLVNEVQRVYRTTGVYISDKHMEVVVRQMLRYVQVSDPGDTEFLPEEIVDRFRFIAANAETLAQGGGPALARPVLLGLTKAVLQTASWVAAASFQHTSKVLTNAAMRGQVDGLKGFKERVVLGERIPQLRK